MSHHGTNWAIQQRGLKPATKLVLWHLADRHNPDFGCFPSQAQLAHDAEMSRSSLNEHLDLLEAAGLMRRERRHDPVSHKRLRTRYILAFEAEFSAPSTPDSEGETGETEEEHSSDPCPESGHGSACGKHVYKAAKPVDNSGEGGESHVRKTAKAMSGKSAKPCPEASGQQEPVREPVREPVKEEDGAQARARPASKQERDRNQAGAASAGVAKADGGSGGAKAAASSAPSAAEVLRRVQLAVGLEPGLWLPAWWRGQEAEAHVARWVDALGAERVVEVAAASRESHPSPPDGPKALDRAMERAARAAARPGTAQRRGNGRGDDPPAASSTGAARDTVELFASKIADGVYLPPSAVAPHVAREMLARGLVTAEQLRARGIAA